MREYQLKCYGIIQSYFRNYIEVQRLYDKDGRKRNMPHVMQTLHMWKLSSYPVAIKKAEILMTEYFKLCPFAIKFVHCAHRYSVAINFVKDRYAKLVEAR